MKLFKLALIGLLASALHLPAQTSLTNGLVLYYPFDGSVVDASGNLNNPTSVVATPAADRFGNPTNAMAFNGVNSGIVVPNFFFFNQPAPFTASIWMCPSNNLSGTNEFTLFCDGAASSAAYGDSLYCADTGLQAYYWTSSNTPRSAFSSQTNFQANVWYNIVGVFTSTSLEIYINGVLQGSSTFSPTSVRQYGNLDIGAQQWNNGTGYRFGFQGRLDDIRFYDHALSSTEVGQLFSLEQPKIGISLASAVVPTFSGLAPGANYQLQVSPVVDGTYTNYGAPFTATNSSMNYSGYFLTTNTTQLYFRVQAQ